MTLEKNLTIRVNTPWLNRIGSLLNVVANKARQGGRARSELIRETIDQSAALWLDSPYIALQAKHLVVVLGNGDMMYHGLQELRLNTARIKLPCSIGMKDEKVTAYCEADAFDIEGLRQLWLLNHFSAWRSEAEGKQLLVSHVDHQGITEKAADLRVDLNRGAVLSREIIAANKDYVQRRRDPRDRTSARGGVPVDIPTLNFDLQVLVDLDVYGVNDELREEAKVRYEFRSRDGARFERRNLGSESNVVSWSDDRYPDAEYLGPEYQPTLEAVRASFLELVGRIRMLTQPEYKDSSGNRAVVDDAVRERLQSIDLPEQFLFGRLTWPRPYQGLEICVTWNKPEAL